MRKQNVAVICLAVNAFIAADCHAESVRSICRSGMAKLVFDTELIDSVIRTPNGISIMLNERKLAAEMPRVQEHIRNCAIVLSGSSLLGHWPQSKIEEN